MWVALNDHIVEQQHAHISIFDHGFLYGDGIYETLRVYHGHQFLLDRHIKRLQQSCELIGIPMPIPRNGWACTIDELLERNVLADAIVRISISRGEGALGLDPALCSHPTVVIVTRPLPHYPPALREEGVSIAVVQTQRQTSSTLPHELKSLSFLTNVLAKREALQAGVFDGLMTNRDGHLTECTTSNFFFVQSGRLCTPSPHSGILQGITRMVVIELAQQLRWDVDEGTFIPQDLLQAEECFLTNTGFEILPVRNIQGLFMNHLCPGHLTQTLQQAFSTFVQQQREQPTEEQNSGRE